MIWETKNDKLLEMLLSIYKATELLYVNRLFLGPPSTEFVCIRSVEEVQSAVRCITHLRPHRFLPTSASAPETARHDSAL
jgi:hypothetical protein